MRGASSAATANRSAASASMPNGRAAIEWGVYGVLGKRLSSAATAAIAYKLIGPITPDNLRGHAGARDRARSQTRELNSS